MIASIITHYCDTCAHAHCSVGEDGYGADGADGAIDFAQPEHSGLNMNAASPPDLAESEQVLPLRTGSRALK